MKAASLAVLALAALAATARADDGGAWNWGTPDPGTVAIGNRQISVGNIDAVSDQSNFRFDWNGTGTAPALPRVEGAATAVGNLQTLEIDKNLSLQSTQFAAGRIPGTPAGAAGSDAWMGGLGDGLFAVGSATAAAKADNVVNGQVDLTAIAASNMSMVKITPPAGAGASAALSLSQTGKHDVSAAALATGTTIDSALVSGPLANPASRVNASAFGNMSSVVIKAGVPNVGAP